MHPAKKIPPVQTLIFGGDYPTTRSIQVLTFAGNLVGTSIEEITAAIK